MDLSNLSRGTGEWLSGTGPESDLVMSSRIRLARNLDGHPFLSKANSRRRTAIESQVGEVIDEATDEFGLTFLRLKPLNAIDRCVLMERHLISREHAFSKGDRGVAFNAAEDVAIMVNEEDHLRLQALRSGFQLRETWREMDEIDTRLEERLGYAYDEQYGYLTACPTNAGTGLRASVMLHLPALVMTQQMDKVFQAVTKISLAVRGLYGEGTQALGDFYQISNQITLGKTETEIIDNISDIIPQIIDYERKVRQTLLESKRTILEDKIWRAYGTLSTARIISSKETLENLSLVRLGLNLEILPDLTQNMINDLFILTQPGHLQKLHGEELESMERDVARADFIRNYLDPTSER
ncbi:MAG: protein arginine kinase [Planctomycetota bacterium]